MNAVSSLNPSDIITPDDIDTSAGLVGDFEIVTQHVACNIVLLYKKSQNWTAPFSFTELASVSSESSALVFKVLGGLCAGGFLHASGNNAEWFYTVTESFVQACASQRSVNNEGP